MLNVYILAGTTLFSPQALSVAKVALPLKRPVLKFRNVERQHINATDWQCTERPVHSYYFTTHNQLRVTL